MPGSKELVPIEISLLTPEYQTAIQKAQRTIIDIALHGSLSIFDSAEKQRDIRAATYAIVDVLPGIKGDIDTVTLLRLTGMTDEEITQAGIPLE